MLLWIVSLQGYADPDTLNKDDYIVPNWISNTHVGSTLYGWGGEGPTNDELNAPVEGLGWWLLREMNCKIGIKTITIINRDNSIRRVLKWTEWTPRKHFEWKFIYFSICEETKMYINNLSILKGNLKFIQINKNIEIKIYVIFISFLILRCAYAAAGSDNAGYNQPADFPLDSSFPFPWIRWVDWIPFRWGSGSQRPFSITLQHPRMNASFLQTRSSDPSPSHGIDDRAVDETNPSSFTSDSRKLDILHIN